MGRENYSEALKLGKKDYHTRMLRGIKPTLQVLDDIMPERGEYSEVPLGLVQIPADQLVGTKTVGRSSSFASNFMPILAEDTEFASKWSNLSDSHVEEGIRDPIKAYEYMNRFYVEEGNKRVSVMKFFGVVSILGNVTRIVPKRTEEKENRIYYEFLDFYRLAPINYIWFSKEGNFEKLQEVVGKEPGEEWTEEELLKFSSLYTRFSAEYQAKGGNKLKITTGDAFLVFAELYGYDAVDEKTTNELKELITKSWEEFELLQEGQEIDLKMEPSKEKKPLLNIRLPLSSTKLKIAFIYEKTPGTSAWTYAHELGRLHLEQAFSDEVSMTSYENGTTENIDSLIEDAISAGCNLIFTTTPSFIQASVKAAIANPKVRILNCSLNTSHRYIRTYYSRMHEAKFLMGAIAGAMAENNKLTYIADYPICGSIANINAFALGAQMVNPRAKVYLEWSTMKDVDIEERIKEVGSSCVSGRDMMIPEEASRY
ncbi:MAG: BMP family ABC transporter substrate-binding protein, partial [Lachnospiraceae bacterium]|nr:BMP family ABC transporter substrate-binding protein [Lachnospiraceae bacterium]